APARPRSHRLEDEQRVEFESLLAPEGWVYRPLARDYGIDGQVEVFDNGAKTGLSFYVQLRATDQADLAKATRIRLKPGELDYYLSKSEPVLVAKYVSASRSMYWIWASRLRREGKWSRDAVGAFGLGMPLIWSDKTL